MLGWIEIVFYPAPPETQGAYLIATMLIPVAPAGFPEPAIAYLILPLGFSLSEVAYPTMARAYRAAVTS